jgi:hypothetical protein
MTTFWTWWKVFNKCQKSWKWQIFELEHFSKNVKKVENDNFLDLVKIFWKMSRVENDDFFDGENFSKNVKKVENYDFLDLVKIFQKTSKKLKMISWT